MSHRDKAGSNPYSQRRIVAELATSRRDDAAHADGCALCGRPTRLTLCSACRPPVRVDDVMRERFGATEQLAAERPRWVD